MANKNAKHDPLEAAKITGDRAAADTAALGQTMHMDPTRPMPPAMGTPVEPGQFVPPPSTAPDPEPLMQDGPTIEEYIASGYKAETYPPEGWAEQPSPGLTRHKAGGVIEPEWINAARAKLDALDAERSGSPPPAAAVKVVYLVLEDGRAGVGHGQINLFRKGDVLEQDGYGHRGIQRLIDGGLKLERQER